jgi:DNA-binding GntR family transcriptional regulator
MNDFQKLKAISSPSTTTVIADQLRDVIRSGSLRPSQQLSESKIAEQLEVSRGPVREAIQRLVQEGLLVSVRNRGVFVADITTEDVVEIYEARETLETRCGVKLLQAEEGFRRTMVQRLQEIVDKLSTAERNGKWSKVIELDLSFHTTLVEAGNNSRIQRAYSTLVVESSLCINRLKRFYPDDGSLVREHQDILDALVAEDEARFLASLRVHYLSTLGTTTAPDERSPAL